MGYQHVLVSSNWSSNTRFQFGHADKVEHPKNIKIPLTGFVTRCQTHSLGFLTTMAAVRMLSRTDSENTVSLLKLAYSAHSFTTDPTLWQGSNIANDHLMASLYYCRFWYKLSKCLEVYHSSFVFFFFFFL